MRALLSHLHPVSSSWNIITIHFCAERLRQSRVYIGLLLHETMIVSSLTSDYAI